MIFGNAKFFFFLQMSFRENFFKLVKTFSMFIIQEQNNTTSCCCSMLPLIFLEKLKEGDQV